MDILYAVRTKDNHIIIWDEESQYNGKGGYNEFFFVEKTMAEAMLHHIKEVYPEAEFKMVEVHYSEIIEETSFTAEDIRQKAIEQMEERNA